MQKRAPEAMVAQSFTILAASVATMAAGDLVKIVDDMTIDFCDADGDVPCGQVIAIDKPAGKATVELFGDRIIEQISGAAITAGSRLKVGAAKGKVVASAPETGVVAGAVSTAADVPASFALALNTVDAADKTVYCLVPFFA